jgi:hypothetical protein
MTRFRIFVFRLFEKRTLRDWFYTIAFFIFVPVGYRFAALAWQYGSWVDKPLAVIAGIFIGITTVVTLLRFWHVAPRQVVTAPLPEVVVTTPKVARSTANDLMAAVRRRAAENRAMAMGAGALGSTLGRRWNRY